MTNEVTVKASGQLSVQYAQTKGVLGRFAEHVTVDLATVSPRRLAALLSVGIEAEAARIGREESQRRIRIYRTALRDALGPIAARQVQPNELMGTPGGVFVQYVERCIDVQHMADKTPQEIEAKAEEAAKFAAWAVGATTKPADNSAAFIKWCSANPKNGADGKPMPWQGRALAAVAKIYQVVAQARKSASMFMSADEQINFVRGELGQLLASEPGTEVRAPVTSDGGLDI